MADMSQNGQTGSPFPETADIHTSTDEYAGRFAGATGQWMLDVQERLTLGLLKGAGCSTVLDVGGGHGQLAIPLCRDGYRVTVLGSDASCRHRVAGIADGGACQFVVGNVIALPFPDKSFDAVISFRLVTHCEQWPALIRELCRVARRCVIVDYPTNQGVNAIAPMLFEAKKKAEGNTRTWRMFKHAEIADAFGAQGFAAAGVAKQFFLPMVLHRLLKSRGVSAALEAVCRGLGLTGLWGSPVIVRMDPVAGR